MIPRRSLVVFALCCSRIWADCSYTTIAGAAYTFKGDGVPVSAAVFNNPQAIAGGPNGSIYIADTGNSRVRRISSTGIVDTVAGTGQPAFGGDGGPGRQAMLNHPSGLAVASDGTVYIADTGNNRIRALAPNGTIRTIAGDGHARFGGDGGPASLAWLNAPTSLSLDGSGGLIVVDSVNARVRRIGSDATIQTIAGAQGVDDYKPIQCCSTDPAPGTQSQLFNPRSARAGFQGEVYIVDDGGLRVLDAKGVLTTLVAASFPEKIAQSPTPVSSLVVRPVVPVPLQDGTLLLITGQQVLVISNGTATKAAISDIAVANDAVLDNASNTVLSLFSLVVKRSPLGGPSANVYLYANPTDASKAASPLDLWLGDVGYPLALAAAPDGTIYVSQSSGKIFSLRSDGSMTNISSPGGSAYSMTVDSKGNLYATGPNLQGVWKIPPGGKASIPFHTAATGYLTALGVDGQDSLYLFTGQYPPVVSYDTNGTPTLIGQSISFGSYAFSNQEPMAVSRSGSVYLGIYGSLGNIVRFPGNGTIVPMEASRIPNALAVSPDGSLYFADYYGVYKLLSDGTILTLIGGDGYGFWGEHGYDSAPQGPGYLRIGGLAVDSTGGLLVLDQTGGAVRRIDLNHCTLAPAPRINAMADSATSDTDLKLSAGQLFSIYGKRLSASNGPSQLDSKGHVPTSYGGTQVTVNGVPAPLLYVSDKQINAIVPFDLAGQQTARVSVTSNSISSDVATGTIANYGPAIFSYPKANDPWLYADMINADGTINSAQNPAKAGTIVTIFGSGIGATNPAGEDGAVAGLSLKTPQVPVQVLVNGAPATVWYAGTAPGLVEGVAQINFQVPQLPGSTTGLQLQMGNGTPAARMVFYIAP